MSEPALCPSGRARPGSLLTGIVGPSGRVASIQPAIAVTAEWIERGGSAADLETRFRFAEPCVRSGCAFWSDNACRISRAVAVEGAKRADGHLPDCSIRPFCRWYRQDGPSACVACPLLRRSSPALKSNLITQP